MIYEKSSLTTYIINRQSKIVNRIVFHHLLRARRAELAQRGPEFRAAIAQNGDGEQGGIDGPGATDRHRGDGYTSRHLHDREH